jgi:hypothetical protein
MLPCSSLWLKSQRKSGEFALSGNLFEDPICTLRASGPSLGLTQWAPTNTVAYETDLSNTRSRKVSKYSENFTSCEGAQPQSCIMI